MTGKKTVEHFKRRPISGELFIDVTARVLSHLRAETTKQINAVRAELGLPVQKPRVRMPAGRGETW